MGTCWPELEGLEVREDLGVQVVGCRGELCLFEGAQTTISPGLLCTLWSSPSMGLGSHRG